MSKISSFSRLLRIINDCAIESPWIALETIS